MSEVTKQKVLSIDTNKAQKNVKSLKQVIKELRDEMALLEKGTAEYDAMSKKLADAMQKQREIAEAAKYSNKDIGAVLGNIATIGAGAVGAINGVSAALQLVGVEGEDAEEALKNIQLTMALIQGMSALDTALKAVKGLSNAFKGLNAQRITNTGTTLGAAGAEGAEAAALVENTKEMLANNQVAGAYDTANELNKKSTDAAADAIKRETELLQANRKVKSEGDVKLNERILDEYETRINNLTVELDNLRWANEDVWDTTQAKYAGEISGLHKVSELLAEVKYFQDQYTQSIGKGADVEKKALDELTEKQLSVFQKFDTEYQQFSERWNEIDDLYSSLQGTDSLESDEGVKILERMNELTVEGVEYVNDYDDAEKALLAEMDRIEAKQTAMNGAMKDILAYAPDQELLDRVSRYNELRAEEIEINKRNEETYKELSKARMAAMEAEADHLEDATEKWDIYNKKKAEFDATPDSKRLDEIYAEINGRTELNDAYIKEIETRKANNVWTIKENTDTVKTAKSIDAETASIKANTKAKKENAGATNLAAGAEANLGKTAKTVIPLQTKIANGIRGLGTAIKSFIVSNPILLAIAAAIGAIAAGIAIYTNAMKKANKERREMAEIANNVNHSYEEENVRLRTLLQTVNDAYETQAERKKAYEELNKIIPEYNAHIDETTGAYTANTKALDDYLKKMKEKMLLEAYEGKIKEYMQEQLDLQQKITKIQNSGWNLFGWRIDSAKKKIKELDKDIDRMYRNILNLDLSKALDENKVDTGNKTVKSIIKTFKEVFAQLKTMYENLWNTIFDEKELRLTFNGIYSETDIMLSKIKRVIKSKNLDKYLSDDFKKALKEGFPEDMNFQITLDWVLDKNQSQKFYAELAKENNKLVEMMNSKKPVSEAVMKAQQAVIDKLKEEEANRKLVMEATQKYFEQRRKEANETEKLIEAKEQYLKQLEIERTFKYEQRSGNTYADINKEIAANELLVKQIEDRMAVRQGELNWLKSLPDQNKQVTERIKQLNQEQIDDEKAKNTALANIDEQNYQTRLKYVEEYYEKAKEQADASTAELENNRTLVGWGVVDYNTQLDILKMSLQAIEDTINETAAYYDREIALAADNAERRIELEAEKLEALRQLNADYAAQEIEIEKAKVDRKIAIQQTYTNVMDSITGEIQSLLQTQMANYDQNSKQYKKLAVANGIIDVTKGTLSAFMSGIESGVPAPWNLLVAAVMSGIVFATGMAQLNNIKNATAANATSGSSNVSFGSYDTMTYAQNSDILSSIADQRVYVLESDITSTQNRVQVTESNATF